MKTIVITGASDGIGAAAAKQLAAQGHRVIIVGRSETKTKAIADQTGGQYFLADYTKLEDVVALAENLRQLPKIDVLANNAGGLMSEERQVTGNGFEKTFQVNHLAEFLLTNLLLDKLIADQTAVIQTASQAANHFGSHFDLNDLNNAKNYTNWSAYGNGKLANILFTRELHRRFHEQGLSAVAFHPGVVRSNFADKSNPLSQFLYHTPVKYLFTISPAASAQRLVDLILGTPDKDWLSGNVYDKKKVMPVKFADPDGTSAKKLWETSLQLVKPFFGN